MDFIHTSLIKSCTTVFSEVISNLASLSISQGSFPLKFKLEQVSRLLKKPGLDKNTPSNYRPISNLNNISKLRERLILSRIQHHSTSSCNFNPSNQHIGAINPLNRRCWWPWTISTVLLTRAHRWCSYHFILALHSTPSTTFSFVAYKPASAYLDSPLHGSTPILRVVVNLSVLAVPFFPVTSNNKVKEWRTENQRGIEELEAPNLRLRQNGQAKPMEAAAVDTSAFKPAEGNKNEYINVMCFTCEQNGHTSLVCRK